MSVVKALKVRDGSDFEKYEVIDGVRVRRGNETKDWWSPINAGVTLVWKLF